MPQSNIYRMVNRCIVLIFVTQFVLCVISTALYGSWSIKWEGGKMWFLGDVLKVRTHLDTHNAIEGVS
jgi:hypothetical protein